MDNKKEFLTTTHGHFMAVKRNPMKTRLEGLVADRKPTLTTSVFGDHTKSMKDSP